MSKSAPIFTNPAVQLIICKPLLLERRLMMYGSLLKLVAPVLVAFNVFALAIGTPLTELLDVYRVTFILVLPILTVTFGVGFIGAVWKKAPRSALSILGWVTLCNIAALAFMLNQSTDILIIFASWFMLIAIPAWWYLQPNRFKKPVPINR